MFRWVTALLIARMLILNYRPDIKGGRNSLLSLMFDMNKLWEDYVYTKLCICQEELGISVHRQSSVGFWTSKAATKTVRPDIVIEKSGRLIAIDTKWKCPKDLNPGDADLKQMFVYKLYYHADSTLLLYPSSAKTHAVAGSFETKVHELCNDHSIKPFNTSVSPSCTLSFLNILDSEGRLHDAKGFEGEFDRLFTANLFTS